MSEEGTKFYVKCPECKDSIPTDKKRTFVKCNSCNIVIEVLNGYNRILRKCLSCKFKFEQISGYPDTLLQRQCPNCGSPKTVIDTVVYNGQNRDRFNITDSTRSKSNKGYKIRISTRFQSEKVQDAAFKLGYIWTNNVLDKKQAIKHTDKSFLFLKNEFITFSNYKVHFKGSPEEEIYWADFVKLAKVESNKVSKNYNVECPNCHNTYLCFGSKADTTACRKCGHTFALSRGEPSKEDVIKDDESFEVEEDGNSLINIAEEVSYFLELYNEHKSTLESISNMSNDTPIRLEAESEKDYIVLKGEDFKLALSALQEKFEWEKQKAYDQIYYALNKV